GAGDGVVERPQRVADRLPVEVDEPAADAELEPFLLQELGDRLVRDVGAVEHLEERKLARAFLREPLGEEGAGLRQIVAELPRRLVGDAPAADARGDERERRLFARPGDVTDDRLTI